MNIIKNLKIMTALLFIAFTIGLIFVVRLFGAWMLRIDEVIKNQEKQIKLTQKLLEKKW